MAASHTLRLLLAPFPEEPLEGGDRFIEAVSVFLVQVAGLAGKSSGGFGDLIPRADHLHEEPFVRVAVWRVAKGSELLSRRRDPLLAAFEHALPSRPLADVLVLRIRGVP
jgi:hypothetical protein